VPKAYTRTDKGKTNGNHQRLGNESKLTAPRSRGGKASIPSESMIQGLKFPPQNPNPRREEGGTERPGRGRWEEQPLLFLREGKEKTGRRRGEGGEGIF